MSIERLKMIKDTLLNCVSGQVGDLSSVNAEEMGEVVDMIKDLEEAMYYCSVVEAMEESKKEKEQAEKNGNTNTYYYTERYIPDMYYRDMNRRDGRMYYRGSGMSPYFNADYSYMNYPTRRYPRFEDDGHDTNEFLKTYIEQSGNMNPSDRSRQTRDAREGRSGMTRRTYMEGQAAHADKATQMKELEKYVQELGKDLTEMIKEASPEEKQILQQKISTLAQKVQ